MPDTLLEIKNLTLERGERLLFQDYSITLRAGEIVQLAGDNGAGKTSLMRVMASLLLPQVAEFSWLGQSVSSAEVFSDEILYLGHKPAVRYQLSPLENLRWYANLQAQQVKSSSPDLLNSALDSLGLNGYENEACGNLSAGQKRRVGLARLAISKSPLWILDEPFTAVDAKGVQYLCSWIEDFAQAGGSVIYTTHQKVEFSSRHPRIIDLASGLTGHD